MEEKNSQQLISFELQVKFQAKTFRLRLKPNGKTVAVVEVIFLKLLLLCFRNGPF